MMNYFNIPINFIKRNVKVILLDKNLQNNLKNNEIKKCLRFLNLDNRYNTFDEFLQVLFPNDAGICLKNSYEYFKGFFAYRYSAIGNLNENDIISDDCLIFIHIDLHNILDTINTMAHEISHCVNDITSHIGIKDDETISYLNGYITEEIFKQGSILEKYLNSEVTKIEKPKRKFGTKKTKQFIINKINKK